MKVYKSSHGGWAARSSFPLSDNKILTFVTMKGFSGYVSTSARVETVEKTGMVSFSPFSDFHTSVIVENIRATVNQIKSQHQRAIARLPEIKSMALATA